MKVWFQNRRTKHKREETEGGPSDGGHPGGLKSESDVGGPDSGHGDYEDDEDEDIDCE